MLILNIYILDPNGKEKMSAHFTREDKNATLTFLASSATIRPKYFLEKDKHCYLKKNAEKILFFTCSEKVKTQGQVNLFFTKIKLVKNEKELEALRYYHAMLFFQSTVQLNAQKLAPKNRENFLGR